MLLELIDLRVYYDKVEAVKGVSLNVADAELVTIIGSNGAGKTSTLNAISGLFPRQGQIRFRGERIDELSPPAIAAKGIIQVPEGGKVFPLLSVLDNLRMGAYLRHDKKEMHNGLEKVFNFFPVLRERTAQKADSLSGGERQMLAIGRGLMAGPTVLLMDEPTLGLSPLLCQRLASQIEKINEEGIAIVLVEQNARMGLRLSRRGYVFERGKVVIEGNSEDLVKMDEIKKAYLGI